MKMEILFNKIKYLEVDYDENFIIQEVKTQIFGDSQVDFIKDLIKVRELLYHHYIFGEPLTEGVLDYICFVIDKTNSSIHMTIDDFIKTKKNLYKTKNKSLFVVRDKTADLTVLCIKIGQNIDDIEIIKPVKDFVKTKDLIDAVEILIKYKEKEKWISSNINHCEKTLYEELLDGRYNFSISKYDNNNFKLDKSLLSRGQLDNKYISTESSGSFEYLIKYKKQSIMRVELKNGEYEVKFENAHFIREKIDSEELVDLWKNLKDVKCLNVNEITPSLIKNIFDRFKMNKMELEPVYKNNKNNYAEKKDKKMGHPNFSDVVGMDKIKERLNDVIHQFKNEEIYEKWHIEPIRSILLYGPSGTGKSFIAEALANEIDAVFIKYSASDIFHQYVGESEAAVRRLFDEARRRNCKTVIFMDEVDAVANKRSQDDNACKNSILNELLVQMSSPDNKNIFMIFATNMVDMLDPAFLRSGRVDFKIEVALPDYNMRKGILELNSQNRPLDDDVDLSAIAKIMSGKNCADVKLVANEAARSALKQHKDKISQKHFRDAYEEMVVGLPDKNRNFELKERHVTAVHETGHLIANILLDNNSEVKSISILPRGSVLGFVHSEDKNIDKYLDTKTELFNKIRVLLAGRAAEELMLGEITTGAANDLEVANNIARNMVIKYGMSDEFGFVTDIKYDIISKEKATNVIREMLKTCYKEVKFLLKEYRDMLVKISEELEDKEELNEAEIKVFIDEIQGR